MILNILMYLNFFPLRIATYDEVLKTISLSPNKSNRLDPLPTSEGKYIHTFTSDHMYC